jgi:hypothetical protein
LSLRSEKRNHTAPRFDIEVPCEETRKVFSRAWSHGLKLERRGLGFQLAFEEACQRVAFEECKKVPLGDAFKLGFSGVWMVCVSYHAGEYL